MTKSSGVKMTAWLLTLTVAAGISVGLPRVAQAGDAGKIIGAVAAGVILYELLDDDNDRGRRACVRPRGWAPERTGWYRDGVPPYPYGKGQVVRDWGYVEAPYTASWYGRDGWRPGRGRTGARLEVYRSPYGDTSIDFGYRNCRRR
jgi:hypothetical protein